MKTLADYRDTIRRVILGITPPIDNPQFLPNGQPNPIWGARGAQPSYAPWPTNATLNDLINRAITYINGETGFSSVYDVSVSVAGQTANGPVRIPMRSIGLNQGIDLSHVNEVRRAWWNPDGTTTWLLYTRSYQELDRDFRQWQQYAPGTPILYWIEGYELFLWPAPASAGTLELTVGTGILRFKTDSDFVDQLPEDFTDTIDYVVGMMWGAANPMDAEAQALAERWTPFAVNGVKEIKAWRIRSATQMQGTLAPRTYRGRAGRSMWG